MRWEFAGEPQKCIKCGGELAKHYYPGMHLTRVMCKNYGKAIADNAFMPFSALKFGEYTGSGIGHEMYVWHDGDQGLPPALSYSVGDMGPVGRGALYTTALILMLVIVVALLMQFASL